MAPRRGSASLLLTLVASALGSQGCDDPASMDGLKEKIHGLFPQVEQLSVEELHRSYPEGAGTEDVLLLDARSPEEFAVSHLPGARMTPDLEAALVALEGEPRDRPIVVYCSVGYRSSALAEELQEKGFSQVRNLEGSIFEWANKGYPVVRNGRPVRQVHPYNRLWGRYLDPKLRATRAEDPNE